MIFGTKLFLNDSIREKYPAVIVFPQCPEKYFWGNTVVKIVDTKLVLNFPETSLFNVSQKLLKGLITHLKKLTLWMKSVFYVGGLSMGGLGTYEIVNQNPEMFAAAFPIRGAANLIIANRIRKPSWWIFHAEIDDVVPVEHSKQMYAALMAVNAEVKLTLYPNVK